MEMHILLFQMVMCLLLARSSDNHTIFGFCYDSLNLQNSVKFIWEKELETTT